MPTEKPPRVGRTSEERTALYRTLTHPVRRRILDHLGRVGEQNSTSLAEELGESTGTTSYHLRKLAEQGLVEEVPERSVGRQRWWRPRPFHLDRPDPADVGADEAEAQNQWHRLRTDRDIALLLRAEREFTGPDGWVQGLRFGGHMTLDDVHRFVAEVHDLLAKYSHPPAALPDDARRMAVRLVVAPEDLAGPAEDPL